MRNTRENRALVLKMRAEGKINRADGMLDKPTTSVDAMALAGLRQRNPPRGHHRHTKSPKVGVATT
jgi:hypothetical protein